MCGRFTLAWDKEEVEIYLNDQYKINKPFDEHHFPRYNIAPSQDVLSIIHDGRGYRAGFLKWGLVPKWAKDEKIGHKMINARLETLDIKPSFKESFRTRRCIILASGFYEWKAGDGIKQPYHIHLKNKQLLAFAGLWSQYKKADGSRLFTCTIVTTAANSFISSIHHRMPVILDEESEKKWLDPRIQNPEVLKQLLNDIPHQPMTMHPVSTLVNHVKNDTIACILPI